MRDWYKIARKEIDRQYGDDAELFCGILAATSANASIQTNVTLAKKAYQQIKETGTIKRESFCKTHYNGILNVLADGKPKGPKCGSFFRALCGDGNAIVIDIWTMRLFGLTTKAPTKRQYEEISTFIRWHASRLGVTPSECQAELWCLSRGSSTNFAEVLERDAKLDTNNGQ